MNPNYLWNEELKNKFHVQGFSIEGVVHFLRKLFCSVLLEVVLLGWKISPVLILRNLIIIYPLRPLNYRDC